MDYAIIRVGGKQHRVRDGETLVVDRLRTDEGGTFEPDVLLGDDGIRVIVKVLEHGRGPKIRIGKYRKRTGYKRHNGFRASTSRIEVSIGGKRAAGPGKAATPAPDAAPDLPAAVGAAAVDAAATALPEGYAEMTVAEIGKAAKTWDAAELEAAHAYEEAHAARKGALSALDSALAAQQKEDA